MTALVTSTYGLDIAVYDQIAAGVTDSLRAAPGFRSHAAYPLTGGFAVTEIWDDAASHKAFFDAAIRPNIPDGVPFEVTVTELHNTIDR